MDKTQQAIREWVSATIAADAARANLIAICNQSESSETNESPGHSPISDFS